MAEDNFLNKARKLKNDTGKIFSDFVGTVWRPSSPDLWFPELDKVAGKYENYRKPLGDLCVTESKFILKLELPGVEKSQVELSAREAGLEIVARREMGMEEAADEKGVCFFERNYQGFYRFVVLPEHADYEKAQAKFQDGILTVVIPKKQAPAASKEKKIEVL